MRILLFEHFSASGKGPDHLAREGFRMVRTLAEEISQLKDHTPFLLLHPALSPPRGVERLTLPFREALACCDAVWPIAPESGGLLERLSREVVAAGRRLLGCPPEGVALAADKWQTFLRLRECGLPTPETTLSEPPPAPPPWVLKPRDGCGSDSVLLLGAGDLPPEGGGWIWQRFVPGESYSLSLTCEGGRALLLSVNRQQIVRQGRRLALSACRVGILPPFDAELLAERIASAFLELSGYVGVDLVFDGKEVWIVELNPRLTLSYVGLGRAGGKPLGALLARWRLGELSLEALGELWSWRALRTVLV